MQTDDGIVDLLLAVDGQIGYSKQGESGDEQDDGRDDCPSPFGFDMHRKNPPFGAVFAAERRIYSF
jgi:hypothetical protein